MIAHILADAGQVHLDGNALSLQLASRAEARQHQQLRGSHRSGAQDDLAAFDYEGFAAAFDLDADGLLAFQDHAVDLHVGADGEVEAVAHCINVGQGHAHTHAVYVVLGAKADAGGFGVVYVGMVGVSGIGGGLEECLLRRRPGLSLVVAHRHRAVGSVEIVVKVGVVLQLAEVGQAVNIGPAIVAPGRPGVEVFGRAADEGLAVDGAGAAHGLAPWDGHRPLFGRGGSGEGPVVGRTGGAGLQVHGTPAQLEHIGELGEVGKVRASFQQQDRAGRVFGQPGGDDAAGGAAADNDVIVFHSGSPLRWFGPLYTDYFGIRIVGTVIRVIDGWA